MNISELRQVSIHFDDMDPISYITTEKDVNKLVQASIELHGEDAKNREAKEAYFITVNTLDSGYQYWWSTPGLTDNDDPNGATVFCFTRQKIVWESRRKKADDKAQEAYENAYYNEINQ